MKQHNDYVIHKKKKIKAENYIKLVVPIFFIRVI